MSQINVNAPPPVVKESGGDRTAAAGINMITVLIVLAVLAVVAWYLFTGPLRGLTSGTATTGPNVTVNTPPPPAPVVNVNPPPAPAGKP